MSQVIIPVTSGNLPPDVPLQFTTDSGIAVPAANNLNVLGGTGIATSGAGSTITVTVTNDGFAWSEESLSFAMLVEHGYFCNASLTATLPATAGLVVGNSVIIYVDTANPVIIQANTGQLIEISSSLSTATGTATSTAQGNVVELVFKPSDLTWHAIASQGTWVLA